MRKLLSSIVLIGMFGIETTLAETVLRRVHLQDGSPSSTVVGMETDGGVIVGVGSVDKRKTGIRGTVRVQDLQDKNNVVLRNGRRLETRDIDFVYVQETLKRHSELGKHPNIDDNTSGGN